MLDHLYAKFDKAYYAGLCKAIAVGKDIPTCCCAFISLIKPRAKMRGTRFKIIRRASKMVHNVPANLNLKTR